jgi:O-antigen biosynthesis protein WbqP
MKRFFDGTLSLLALLFLAVPMLLTALLVKLTSKGPNVAWITRLKWRLYLLGSMICRKYNLR